MLIETIDDHRVSYVYTLRNYLLNHMVEHKGALRALSVSDSGSYEHVKELKNQAYRKPAPGARMRMMKTVYLIATGNSSFFQYVENEIS